MTGLEAAEMRFLRSVTGYTILHKILSEDIRQELEISGIQDVRLDQPPRKIGQHQTTEIRHLQSQGNKRSRTTRPRDLWNTRRETQIQTKLDQPPRKNGQHQTAEIRPQLQTPGKKGSRTPQETMATRRCRNRSNELNHGGR